MPLPLTNDKTTLTVKFYWQKKQHRTQETMSLLTEPHPTTDLNENIGSFDDHTVKLFGRNDCRIKSGDAFVLKTDDPIMKPLPSFKLLELQWFLTRIVGMAGAAIPYDPDWNDDSDEEAIVALPYDLDWVDDSGEEASKGLSDSEHTDIISDQIQPDSPKFLRKGTPLHTEGSKHRTEETGEGQDKVRIANLSNLIQPDSPEFVQKGAQLPIESSRHRTEEAEEGRDEAGELAA
jgi:hypothetical protein